MLSARQHVGAAGFAQSEALERIVSAGREQITLAQSIRKVVATTQSQLQDLALGLDPYAAQVQTATLVKVSADVVERLEAAEHDRSGRELASLEDVHTQTVLRICELEQDGLTHAAQ